MIAGHGAGTLDLTTQIGLTLNVASSGVARKKIGSERLPRTVPDEQRVAPNGGYLKRFEHYAW